jgi:hypothetical protein
MNPWLIGRTHDAIKNIKIISISILNSKYIIYNFKLSKFTTTKIKILE